MGGEKRRRKFLKKKGNLKSKVTERRKRQKVKKMRQDRKLAKKANAAANNVKKTKEERATSSEESSDETNNATDASNTAGKKQKSMASMGLGDFLSGGFLQSSDDEEGSGEETHNSASAYGPPEKPTSSKMDEESESSGSSDSDDEEDEALSHKKELEALKKRDPEFYEYLRKSDSGLLDFEVDDEEDSDEPNARDGSDDVNNDNDDEEGEEEEEEDDEDDDRAILLSAPLLASMMKAVFEKRSLRALPKLIQAFRSACHLSSSSSGSNEADARSMRVAKSRPYKFKLKDSAVFNELMITAISKMASTFRHHLQMQEEDGAKDKRTPDSRPRWEKLRPAVASFCGNMLHFLSQLMDREMQLFVLQSLRPYMPFFASLTSLHRKTIKILLRIFAGKSSLGAAEDETSGTDVPATSASDVRLAAFLRLRQLVVLAPPRSLIVDTALKGIYLTHIRNSKFVSEITAPTIAMRRNCVVELFLLDPRASYQQVFVYIRQLAITLRLALCNPSKETARTVYNWQFLESSRTWCQLLCAASCGNGGAVLRPLVYPLVQIIRGAATLQATASFVPMRLHCASLLNDIAAAADVYIPSTPMLLAVLTSAPFRGGKLRAKKQAKMLKPPNLDVTIRLQKAAIESSVVKDQVVLRTLALLTDFFETHRYSIAFPELLFPVSVQLRQFLKTSKVPLWRQAVRQLLKDAESWSRNVVDRRKDVDFGPADVERAASFMSEEKRAARSARVSNPLLGRVLRQQQQQQQKSADDSKQKTKAAGQKKKKKKSASNADDSVIMRGENRSRSDDAEERTRRHSLLLVQDGTSDEEDEEDVNSDASDEVGDLDMSSSSEEDEESESE